MSPETFEQDYLTISAIRLIDVSLDLKRSSSSNVYKVCETASRELRVMIDILQDKPSCRRLFPLKFNLDLITNNLAKAIVGSEQSDNFLVSSESHQTAHLLKSIANSDAESVKAALCPRSIEILRASHLTELQAGLEALLLAGVRVVSINEDFFESIANQLQHKAAQEEVLIRLIKLGADRTLISRVTGQDLTKKHVLRLRRRHAGDLRGVPGLLTIDEEDRFDYAANYFQSTGNFEEMNPALVLLTLCQQVRLSKIKRLENHINSYIANGEYAPGYHNFITWLHGRISITA